MAPDTSFPWPVASATGIGSLPGIDPGEAMRLIFGELPDLPHLAELPARGPGADLVGRTASLLVDLPVETTPGGWRFAGRPGRDLSRAQGMLAADLDTLEEVASGYQGPLKIQVAGPWTVAAAIELPHGANPALADPGAVADLTASLAEGLRAHVEQVSRRVPGAQVLVQVDEPALPAVIAGVVPTASGLARLPAPEASEVESGLRAIVSAAQPFPIVHCCAMPVPLGIIAGSGARAVSFDLGQLRPGDEEALAALVEAGLGVLAGVVPTTPPPVRATVTRDGVTRDGVTRDGATRDGVTRDGATRDGAAPGGGGREAGPARAAAGRVTELWRRMGWPSARQAARDGSGEAVAGQVVLTPACGLAGATPGYSRVALVRCREASRLLPELIEEGRR